MTARRARAGAVAGRGRRSGNPAPARRPLPDAARALLAIPPARFTAAREELARRLATEDPGAAAAVRALRRPVGLAWLLNRAARDAPGDVDALLSAADRLRGGPGRPGLREAEEALRSSARALRLVAARAAGEEGARAVDLPRVELLLRVAAAADAGTRDALRQGALAREPEGLGFGAGLMSTPAGPAGDDVSPRARAPADGTPQAARRRERDEAVRARRRARELERARRTLRAAEVAAQAARREAERLEADAQIARERAGRAEAHVSRARAALEALERP